MAYSDSNQKSKNNSFLKSQPGFTLIETLVAMAIIAIVSVMVMATFLQAMNSDLNATKSENAAQSAERQIAMGSEPARTEHRELPAGGFSIPSNIDIYTEAWEGSTKEEQYRVISGGEDTSASGRSVIFGDFTGVDTALFQEIYQFVGITGGGTGSEATNVFYYTIPASGSYLIECWGASGGSIASVSGEDVGEGGYASGMFNLRSGETLAIFVGGQGQDGGLVPGKSVLKGGFGGGGDGYQANNSGGSIRTGGGGASDVRIGSYSLYERIIVAGGGGGASGDKGYSTGSGGGQEGTGGKASQSVTNPGTMNSGGWNMSNNQTGTYVNVGFSGFGVAGSCMNTSAPTICGGGGGWYGGGAGNGGGGGSGWVLTESAFAAWKPTDGDFSNASDKTNYVPGTDYFAESYALITGNQLMPDPLDNMFDAQTGATGKFTQGNLRGGFCRITYIG